MTVLGSLLLSVFCIIVALSQYLHRARFDSSSNPVVNCLWIFICWMDSFGCVIWSIQCFPSEFLAVSSKLLFVQSKGSINMYCVCVVYFQSHCFIIVSSFFGLIHGLQYYVKVSAAFQVHFLFSDQI